ncbi:MAG: hypothetical protein IKZ33_01565, partial [Lentisphaeria bacterium]|nr:hypothetical protein [Lentisphaeria bacterium]
KNRGCKAPLPVVRLSFASSLAARGDLFAKKVWSAKPPFYNAAQLNFVSLRYRGIHLPDNPDREVFPGPFRKK